MQKKTITVYDIAKEAGVSPATVSRVLTGNATVKEDKKKRIMEVIEKYNFQPNAVARSLLKKETKTIGIIMPDIRNPFFLTVYSMADMHALKHGYAMMLCNSRGNRELESKYLLDLVEKQVDAMIFSGGRVNDINIDKKQVMELQYISSKMPLVLINGVVEGLDCYKITSNADKGIEKLVDYLVSLGHKNIGLIGGVSNIITTVIRHTAFKRSLCKHGIELNKNWVITGGFSIEDGKRFIKELMKQECKPTAVIAINDLVAVGAIKGALDIGVKIPEDISLAGFDNIYLSEIISPELTTVGHNYELIGQAAINTIMNALSNKSTEREILIDTNLVIRESCKTL